MNKNYLKDKVFLVTGASSGIGHETTKIILENGGFVYAMVRNVSAMDLLKKQFNGKICVFKGDVSRQKDCEKFIKVAVKKWKKIDGLIHCAGVGIRSHARDIKHDVFRSIMDINFFALVYLFSAAREYLEETNGHLVAVSSVQGLVPLPTRSAYGAAKHAMNAYIKSVRLEEDKVHFLCVNFGYVKTNFSHNAVTGEGQKYLKSGLSAEKSRQSKGLEVNDAATLMLNAMIRRKKEIMPAGFKEKLTLFVYRFFPSLFERLITRYVKPD